MGIKTQTYQHDTTYDTYTKNKTNKTKDNDTKRVIEIGKDRDLRTLKTIKKYSILNKFRLKMTDRNVEFFEPNVNFFVFHD